MTRLVPRQCSFSAKESVELDTRERRLVLCRQVALWALRTQRETMLVPRANPTSERFRARVSERVLMAQVSRFLERTVIGRRHRSALGSNTCECIGCRYKIPKFDQFFVFL